MKRLFAGIVGTILLLAPPSLLAQHKGHGTSAPAAPNEPPPDQDLTKFAHAVELQASPRQVLHFNQLTESIAEARKKARGIAGRAVADVLHGADPLIDQLDDIQWEGTRFLASFTNVQKSGLKPFTKKLGKTNNEINRHTKALQAARAKADETEIVATSSKLDEALGKFQIEQQALAREMGIQDGSEE